MSNEVTAAVIGGLAGLLTALFAALLTYRQQSSRLSHESREAEKRLKAEESRATNAIDAQLRTARAEISTRFEELRQSQISELIRIRLKVYPQLYAVISDFGRSWTLRGKPYDKEWAASFLEKLLQCNAAIGVYFSDDVYVSYGELRDAVLRARDTTADGDEVNGQYVNDVLAIIRNRYWGRGLGTYLKDDCGTFQFGSLVAREPTQLLRNRLEKERPSEVGIW